MPDILCIRKTTFLQQLHIIGYDFLICMGFMPYLCYFVYIYIYWCPTEFPRQMMFVLFNGNRKGVTSGAGTANPFEATGFLWGSCSIFSFLCSVLKIIVHSICPFSFGHCIFCPSLIYGFWLLHLYLQKFCTSSIQNYFYLE